MPSFKGVDHLCLSVTDLDRSEHFYTTVLDFTPLMDFGYVRTLLHRPTSFLLALALPAGQSGQAFSELQTGLDHIGLVAGSRDELEEWVSRFDAAGVTYTPIRDMPFGHHLNFRDPDGIPLELYAPNEITTQGYEALRVGDISAEEGRARIQRVLAASAQRP